MTVYVDDAFVPARVGMHRSSWCHLMTDGDVEELHDFARRIGLRRAWFQQHKRLPHYDVTEGARRKAVAAGAVEIGSKDLARLMPRKAAE